MVLTPPDVDINNLELPQLIVSFSEAQNPKTAVDKLLTEAAEALANTTTPGNETTSSTNITVVGNITIPAPAGQAATWGSDWGVKSLVVELPPQVDREAGIKALQTLSNVQAVIPDRLIWAVQGLPRCASNTDLIKGLSGNPSRSMPSSKWGRGMSACNVNTRLRWRGRTCFKAGSQSIQYDSVVVEDLGRPGSIKSVNGQACSISRSTASESSTFFTRWLGSCGTVPIFNQNLPLCLEGAAPPPSPPPPSPVAPPGWITLRPGVTVPIGVDKLGMVDRRSESTPSAAEGGGVAVCDSGVDHTHPDLNVVGGQTFGVQPSPDCPMDADWGADCYGHGTHVAGIVAASGSPGGIIGVAPGARIHSLKILNGTGKGTSIGMMASAAWLAVNGTDQGIQAATYSLTTWVDPSLMYYAATFHVYCKAFEDISRAGIVVAAAAGNANVALKGFFPAACPDVMAVTSVQLVQGPKTAVNSNYLSDTEPQFKKDRTIAAPGVGINSTMSAQAFGQRGVRYFTLPGTSMAAPHVAGVAINCATWKDPSARCANGDTGVDKIAKIQAVARQHNEKNPSYGFSGDPNRPIPGRHYGWLLWGGFDN